MNRLTWASLLTLASLVAQDKPVAQVESKAIYLRDLDPPEAWQSQNRVKLSATDYAAWLLQTRSDRLAGQIWGAVRQQFCRDKDCAATEGDITAFNAAMVRMNREQRVKNDARVREIEKALAGSLDAAERSKLQREKDTLESVRSTLRDAPTDTDRRIAETWIGSWKFYRALHRAHGGRVIFQQAGPEPLDAMTKVLQEHEKRGTFAIYDPELHRKFWAYFLSMGHNFMPDGAKLLETPWWLQPQKR